MKPETRDRLIAIELMAGPAATKHFAGLPPKERTAHHEAGHAVVTLFNDVRQIHSVSIVQDAHSSGRTLYAAPQNIDSNTTVRMARMGDRRIAAALLYYQFRNWRQTRRVLRECQWRAETLVEYHVAEIRAVAAALLERGELPGEEIAWIAWEARPWKPKAIVRFQNAPERLSPGILTAKERLPDLAPDSPADQDTEPGPPCNLLRPSSER